ncbi:hypothetical protein [Metabacillus fastidiosus]|uniref:Uncharacterized protein n=1 Tax=Metabacillus fastidiosus TaxID=1458 RepID=A0ABU6P2X5_9BACI|nr:hypothetical protein [Metabacillus fastidiosus]
MNYSEVALSVETYELLSEVGEAENITIEEAVKLVRDYYPKNSSCDLSIIIKMD